MIVSDIALPVLGFLLVGNSLLSLKSEVKTKDVVEFVVGILIMGFSIWSSITNSDNTETLNTNINKLLEQRRTDSSNNASFQKYVKDTFGIERQGNKAIVYNTNIYNSKASKPKNEVISDSINYRVKLRKDTLIVYPKEGVWVKPFLSFDARLDKINDKIYQGDGTVYSYTIIPHEITIVNNKKYNTITVNMSLARSKERPLVMDISGDKNQYIIFGDEAAPNKRYIYEHGKVNWIPLK